MGAQVPSRTEQKGNASLPLALGVLPWRMKAGGLACSSHPARALWAKTKSLSLKRQREHAEPAPGSGEQGGQPWEAKRR